MQKLTTRLLLTAFITLALSTQLVKTDSVTQQFTYYLLAEDVFTLQVDPTHYNLAPAAGATVTSNNRAVHINGYSETVVGSINGAEECIDARARYTKQNGFGDNILALCDHQTALIELKRDGSSLTPVDKYQLKEESEIATYHESVLETGGNTYLVGFNDKYRNELLVASVAAGAATETQTVALNPAYQADSWAGSAGILIKNTATQAYDEALVVFERASDYQYKGSKVLTIITGATPNATVTQIDYKQDVDATKITGIIELSSYQKKTDNGEQTRLVITYGYQMPTKTVVTSKDCQIALDGGKFTLGDCERVKMTEFALFDGNGYYKIFQNDDQTLQLISFDYQSGHIQICDYSADNRLVSGCALSHRTAPFDSALDINTIQAQAVALGNNVFYINFINRNTYRTVLTLHNIQIASEDTSSGKEYYVVFDFLSDVGSYSILSSQGEYLVLKQNTFYGGDNQAKFKTYSAEFYPKDSQGSNFVADTVTLVYQDGKNTLTYNIEFYALDNGHSNVHVPGDLPQITSTEKTVVKLPFNHFNVIGNDLDIQVTSKGLETQILHANDVEFHIVDQSHPEQTNKTQDPRGKLTKVHHIFEDNALFEYVNTENGKPRYALFNSGCNPGEGDANQLNVTCAPEEATTVQQEYTLWPLLSLHNRGTFAFFTDTYGDDEIDAWFFGRTDGDSDGNMFIETPNANRTAVVKYFGIHPADTQSGTGAQHYLLYTIQDATTKQYTLYQCVTDGVDFTKCGPESADVQTSTAADFNLPDQVFCPESIQASPTVANKFFILLNCKNSDVRILEAEFNKLQQLADGLTTYSAVNLNEPILGDIDNANIQVCSFDKEHIILNANNGKFYGRDIESTQSSGIHHFRPQDYDFAAVKKLLCLPELQVAVAIGYDTDKNVRAMVLYGSNQANARRIVHKSFQVGKNDAHLIDSATAYGTSGATDGSFTISFVDSDSNAYLKRIFLNGPHIYVRTPDTIDQTLKVSVSLEVSNVGNSAFGHYENLLGLTQWSEAYNVTAAKQTNITKGTVNLDSLVTSVGDTFGITLTQTVGNKTQPANATLLELLPRVSRNELTTLNASTGLKATVKIENISDAGYANDVRALGDKHYIEATIDNDQHSVINLYSLAGGKRQLQDTRNLGARCTVFNSILNEDQTTGIAVLYCNVGYFATISWYSIQINGDKATFVGTGTVKNAGRATRLQTAHVKDTLYYTVYNSDTRRGSTGFFLDVATGEVKKDTELAESGTLELTNGPAGVAILFFLHQESLTGYVIEGVNQRYPITQALSKATPLIDRLNCKTGKNKLGDATVTCASISFSNQIGTFSFQYDAKKREITNLVIEESFNSFFRYTPIDLDFTDDLLVVQSNITIVSNLQNYTELAGHEQQVLTFYERGQQNRYVRWGIKASDYFPAAKKTQSSLTETTIPEGAITWFAHKDAGTQQSRVYFDRAAPANRTDTSASVYGYGPLTLKVNQQLTEDQLADFHVNVALPQGQTQQKTLVQWFNPNYVPHGKEPDTLWLWLMILAGVGLIIVGFILYLILRALRNKRKVKVTEGADNDYETFVSKDLTRNTGANTAKLNEDDLT